MIESPSEVASDAVRESLKALEEDDSDLVILGCTIVAACLTRHSQATGEYRDVPIVNPNLLALKSAEMLADLYQRDEYRLSRRGYYERQSSRSPEEFDQVRNNFRLSAGPAPV